MQLRCTELSVFGRHGVGLGDLFLLAAHTHKHTKRSMRCSLIFCISPLLPIKLHATHPFVLRCAQCIHTQHITLSPVSRDRRHLHNKHAGRASFVNARHLGDAIRMPKTSRANCSRFCRRAAGARRRQSAQERSVSVAMLIIGRAERTFLPRHCHAPSSAESSLIVLKRNACVCVCILHVYRNVWAAHE